ncbi:MAG TPA: hypothetical protein VF661_07095 [Actinomycetales bacterium]|jgi:hypothetical protein
MLIDNSAAQHTVKRMLDYFAAATPWSRRLWRLGTLLEVEELAEAARARHEGALSESAVRYLADGLTRRVREDHGFGSAARRGLAIDHIKRTLTPDSHDLHAVHTVVSDVAPKYLMHWADAARASTIPPESLSRAVASHLLDAGYSATALHKWLTYHCSHSPEQLDLPDLVECAQALVARPSVRYEVLVPITASPPLGEPIPESWLGATAASQWLAEWFSGQPVPRQSGALLLAIDARDPYSAVDQVRNALERLSARFRVGARRALRFADNAYLLGEATPFPLAAVPRRVEVQALERTRSIFDLRLPQQIDAALELLEPIDTGAPAAAVAGSWASLETLLVGPGDTSNRVVAATRMARVVACSYFRAEFTALANAHMTTSSDGTARDLRDLGENKARAVHLEQLFRANAEPAYVGKRHVIAALRMRQVVDNPKTIERVVQQLEDAFRRLYRQRNLIVHAGQTSSVALDGCLRTTAPLVGAGIDRIVHAGVTRGIEPLALAALAEVRLREARTAAGTLVDMLP